LLAFSRAKEMRCRGSPFEPYPAAVASLYLKIHPFL